MSGSSSSTLRVHSALIAVGLLFSLNYVISKFGLHAFSSMTFAYLRVLGSAIVLNLMFRDRDLPPLSAGDRWRMVAYSMLGVVINQTLFLTGLSLTSAHVAAILMTLIPLFALAAAIAVGRERATVGKMAGIALALAGALAVVGREGIEGADKSLIGDLLLIANAFAYSLYLVFSKPDMERLSPRRVIARMFGIGAVIMLPLSAPWLLSEQWATIPRSAWVSLLVVIAGPTVAAYLLNAWALAHTDSSLVATYTYLQPVITMILAAIFLGERIRPVAIAAAALIFAGVYLAGRPAPPAARPEAVPGGPD
jgi:drug/metabolite transporter (DMT)-like permease